MKTKYVIMTILLILGLVTFTNAKPLTLNEVLEGSCRVSVSGGTGAIGSGTCIGQDDENYIFLTNGHVVKNHKTASVELFRGGYKSYKIPATVVKTFWQDRTDKDFSLLAVNETYVSKCPPRIIPLVPLGYDTSIGYTFSAGCPNGKWLHAWEGRIEEKQPTRLIFTPPPVSGQSGSGLLINIKDKNGELHTRVGAVITFRIGKDGIFSDRQDKDGFELAQGAAIPITTLYKLLGYNKTTYQPTAFPPNYIETQSNIICKWCNRIHTQNPHDYAFSKYGTYHCAWIGINGQPDCRDCRPGDIDRWPDWMKGRMGPIPNPLQPTQPKQPSNDGNPFGDNLPHILPPELTPKEDIVPLPNPQDETIQQLKQQVQDLEKQIETLTLINEGLEQNLSTFRLDADHNADQWVTEKQKLDDDLTQSKQNELDTATILAKKLDEIDKISTELDTTSNEINALTANLTSIESDNINLENRVKETTKIATEETEKVKNQRNWFSGLGGGLGVILSSLGWMYWNKRGRKKAGQMVDNVQNRVDNKLDNYLGEDLVNQLHDMVDDLQDAAADAVNNAIKSQLPPLVEKIVEKKTTEDDDGKENVEDNVENNIKNCDNQVDKSRVPQYNKRRNRKPKREISEPVSVNITNTNTGINDYKINDCYLKEFFKHKIKDGEKIKDWALYGTLYKEAIEELGKGKLYYKGKTRLLGQQKTAQQINEWVREEFLKRITRRDIFHQDELYKEAMLGFLYKDAVTKLAAGYFTVLGYQDTATAIRNWVNKEFLQRINVIT